MLLLLLLFPFPFLISWWRITKHCRQHPPRYERSWNKERERSEDVRPSGPASPYSAPYQQNEEVGWEVPHRCPVLTWVPKKTHYKEGCQWQKPRRPPHQAYAQKDKDFRSIFPKIHKPSLKHIGALFVERILFPSYS